MMSDMGAEYRAPPAWFCLAMNLYAAGLLASHRVYECDCAFPDDWKADHHVPVGERCRDGGLNVYYISTAELYAD